mgnify:CR=1 FL=1
MILRVIHFVSVWIASGTTNFFGQGWWYHPWLWLFGLDFSKATFVAKTTTLLPRLGNMPMKRDGMTPREFKPKCIHVNLRTGAAVNAVGLSGPGLEFLLNTGRWQARRSPFLISFMSLASTPEERLEETRKFVSRMKMEKPRFRADFGIQANYSCPNGGLDPSGLIKEVLTHLDELGALGVPIVPKFGPDLLPEAAIEIARHPACDALCVFNTLQWNNLPEAERLKFFGTTVSPLEKRFGPKFKGGVSGRPLTPITLAWLKKVRAMGLRKPINAGGGILSLEDARQVMRAGADSISIGSMAFLAPTQVRRTIRQMNREIEGWD